MIDNVMTNFEAYLARETAMFPAGIFIQKYCC
jgi:hypothetical protein